MRNVGVKIFSLVLVTALSGASQASRTLASGGLSGPFKLFFGLSGVYSYKTVKLASSMRTKYKAEYVCAPESVQTLAGSWGVAPAVGARNTYTLPFAGDYTGMGVAPAVPLAPDAGLMFVYAGQAPSHWFRGGNYAGELRTLARNEARAALTHDLKMRALFAPGANYANMPPVPAQKALVPSAEYEAVAERDTELKYGRFGLCAELGFGLHVLDELMLRLSFSYTFDVDKEGYGAEKDGVSFKTQGEESKVLDARRDSMNVNFIASSFAYAKGQIAEDMKVKVKVDQTLGVMAGCVWVSRCLDVIAQVGVKRYTIEALFEGGFLSYPGTVGMYTDDFARADGGRYRLSCAQDGQKRKMVAVAWPVLYGCSLRFKIFPCCAAQIGLEYTSFKVDLSAETAPEDQVHPSVVVLSNPYQVRPTLNQMRDGQGVHQMVASDVSNVLVTNVEVKDISVSMGVTVAL